MARAFFATDEATVLLEAIVSGGRGRAADSVSGSQTIISPEPRWARRNKVLPRSAAPCVSPCSARLVHPSAARTSSTLAGPSFVRMHKAEPYATYFTIAEDFPANSRSEERRVG